MGFGQDSLQALELADQAAGFDWGLFPVQAKLCAELDELDCDADDADEPKRFDHIALV